MGLLWGGTLYFFIKSCEWFGSLIYCMYNFDKNEIFKKRHNKKYIKYY